MCTFNTASGCDCRCECDILLREDRDLCPEHGTKAQAVQAPRRVSVGRTQPLWGGSERERRTRRDMGDGGAGPLRGKDHMAATGSLPLGRSKSTRG